MRRYSCTITVPAFQQKPCPWVFYRKHHSTSDALLLAVEGISQARAAHLHTGIAFVDMSKAFDKVQHQTLIYDLFNIGISGSVLRWLANYLSGRHQYVQVGMNKSNPYASSSGCSLQMTFPFEPAVQHLSWYPNA